MSRSHFQGKLNSVGGYLTIRNPDGGSFRLSIYHLDELGQERNGPYQAVPFSNSEDARRLAACWNYCHGIPTEELETDLNAVGSITTSRERFLGWLAEIEALKAERDTLYALINPLPMAIGSGVAAILPDHPEAKP